ncbi:nuclear transport factor 2 family protein [Flavobacterium johnsoniae]|uniref:nuclear transport factor 2 family protein n=1 Tax=Flavobacterium johnsoniae TaxID=986 RepID=UPI0009F90A63|nr:nuclear transport factor 2 family protein [Flavobacterium johnsoniae]
MSSEQQIQNLIGRYTHYVDQARFDKIGDLFANGKIISPRNVIEGRKEVISQLSKNLQVYADGTLERRM